MKKFLLVDVHPSNGLASSLTEIITCSSDFHVDLVRDIERDVSGKICMSPLLKTIRKRDPDLIGIIVSDDVKHIDRVFNSIKKDMPELPVIIVIDDCSPDEAISLLKLGASDFLTPPLKAIDVLPRIWRIIQQRDKRSSLTHKLKEQLGLRQLIGKTPAFLSEVKKIPIMANCDSTVLVSGETGTGKELFARAIHYLSPRANNPFVPVNCGAIPVELVENELFGHVRGAFTGATASRSGLIHDANGGTLFMDEIDCLSLNAQVKLLRFLQDREYRQLGSSKMFKADIRIITASNNDLEDAVSKGKFRRDLYYRINIIPAQLPPLRERTEDIPLLARFFLDRYSSELKKEITGFAAGAFQKLVNYEWPGNVRELENIVERAVVFSRRSVIQHDDIALHHVAKNPCDDSFRAAKSKAVEDFEKSYIQGLLLANHGNITRAAKAAQKNRRAFWELIRKHGIETKDFTSCDYQ
jgi:DNA-binding NtrC family response regulator